MSFYMYLLMKNKILLFFSNFIYLFASEGQHALNIIM